MALPARQQLKYWSVSAAVLFGLLWFLGDVILPFVLGAAVAYCLDPIADRLEAMGMPRVLAVVIMTAFGLLLFVLLILLFVPAIVNQMAGLFAAAPEFVRSLYAMLVERFPSLAEEGSQLRQTVEDLGALIQARGADLVKAALTSVSSVINVVALVVITPVVAFYLLLDWDRMVARVDELLPRDHAPAIRAIVHQVDATLAGFIRGQGTVCLILGTYYSVGLMLVGLDFGLMVGAFAGLLTFIPYIGALVGGAMALGIAVFQFWGEWYSIVLVAAIFFSGQFVEGNFLTPKLVGDSVGLHPVWLLFALSVFGALFGFVGMLVAVPVAAVIGVFARFGIGEYMRGRLYQGLSYVGADGPPGPAESTAERPPALPTDASATPTRASAVQQTTAPDSAAE
ncbi:MAG: AI-2E family transporter [Pseudomonadota bacterium]